MAVADNERLVAMSNFNLHFHLQREHLRIAVRFANQFVEPHEFVAGTTYPLAKAERLPAVAARYTEVEALLLLLDNDLAWLERTGRIDERRVLDEWEARLRAVDGSMLDQRERELLRSARDTVRARR